MRPLLPIGLLSLCSAVLAGLQEQFDESLVVESLGDGRVASKFTFATILKGVQPRDPQFLDTADASQHYSLFPLALGQILREWGVTELHLSLNSGKWDYERWGYPEEKGVGTGAELWAWMGDGASTTIDERWQGLRNSLAGLFCASLGSMGELRTTSPPHSFAPEGDLPEWGLGHQIRHASLPSEHVCTENLTPFLKLLPCKSLSGIARLLNPHRLFDADWHGTAINVIWEKELGVQVRLTFQSVSDPLRVNVGRKQDWSFKSLFDRTIDRNCPAAHSSQVIVPLPKNSVYSIRPEPSSVVDESAHFDVRSLPKPINIGITWPEGVSHREYQLDAVPFAVKRILTGSTQERGQLLVTLNNHRNSTVQTLYLETMPWLVQFYLHTLVARVDGVEQKGVVSNISYILPIPHGRPATFQAFVTLPPRSTVQISMDVKKAFLRYTEHPPDAQRGWDLPPAVFTPVQMTHNRSSFQSTGSRIYTPILLVDLATPDFSMPYNVIIFSCTLIAFLFGSIFNLLMRRFVVVRVDETKGDEKKE